MTLDNSNGCQSGCGALIILVFGAFCVTSMYRGCTSTTSSPSSTSGTSLIRKAEQSKDQELPSAFDSEIEEVFLKRIEEYSNKLSVWNIAKDAKEENEEKLRTIEASLEQYEKKRPLPIKFEERMWTTNDYRHTTKAVLVSIDSTNVTLRKLDGKNVSVERDKLSSADDSYIKRASQDLANFERELKQWEVQKQLLIDETKVLRQTIVLASSNKPDEPTKGSIAGEIELERRKKSEFELEQQSKANKSKQASNSILEKRSGLGKSDRQISKLLGQHFPPLTDSTPVNGKPRRSSLAFDKLATIEVIGDPNDVSTVSLLFGTPKDDVIISLSNTALCALLLFEFLPDWPQSSKWLTEALQRLSINSDDSTSEKVTVGSTTVALSHFKSLGLYCLTIQSN